LRNRRRRRSRASHAVGCAAESCEHRTSRPIGLDVSLPGLLVSKSPTRFLSDAVPRSLKDGFILSRAFLHFRERAASILPMRADTPRHLPRGFLPLRDTSQKSPLTVRFPSRTYRSALSVSHAPDGFLLFWPRGPISSHCHVQDLPFRGFPRRSADKTRRPAYPPLLPLRCFLLQTGEPFCASSSVLDFRGLVRVAIRSRMQRG
jgi:hypothetical protein